MCQKWHIAINLIWSVIILCRDESNRMADTELQQAGLDTEGMAESTAKLREEVMALSGVDIMKNENEFKSTYDILDELANKWSDLTDIQQAKFLKLAWIYRNIYLEHI